MDVDDISDLRHISLYIRCGMVDGDETGITVHVACKMNTTAFGEHGETCITMNTWLL